MSWTLESLKSIFDKRDDWTTEIESGCLSISNDENIDLFLYAGDNQLTVETPLFASGSVTDSASLNAVILRTHQYQPLSTIGIKAIDGDDYYVAFGALSANSNAEAVVEEVETLFQNVDDFLELYESYITTENNS